MSDDNNVSTTDEAFTILPSQRGGKLLLYNGYRYNFRRKNQYEHAIWTCSKKNECPATLVINNNSMIIKSDQHKCIQKPAANEIKCRINKCIERAKNETTPVPTIYAEALEEMKDAGLDLLQSLPNYGSLKKTMYKHRNRSLQAERIRFFQLKDVMIPNIYNNFLFADYNDKKTRILLFASEEGRELLKQAKEAYCDGTFKSAVPPFTQLLSLHVDLGSPNSEEINVVPVLYGLLPNKKSTTYEIFFDLIKSQVPEFNPSVITTDFELGLMGAIQEIYPNTQSRGCLFHFSQAVWRQAKKHGLVKFKLFKPHVRRCIALSYLPIEYRNDAWLYILGECIEDPKTKSFNNYFEQTWLTNKKHLDDKWCFYQVKNKTNNITESWNSRLNKKVKPKPNIAQLLQTLTKDFNYYTTFFKKNKYITKRTNVTMRRQQKIESVLIELIDNEITIGHCIDKIALCLC